MKKLKEKDKKQQDLERREQGFSLYLNGANVDLKLGKAGPQKSARKAKTAGGDYKSDCYFWLTMSTRYQMSEIYDVYC